jgi:phytanoyl-CoA hydroxylase
MVIPGTHQGPVRNHWEGHRFVGSVTDEDFDPTDGAVPIELPAGGVSMHHVRAVHGSASNVSTTPRRLLLFTYAAADAWPLSGIPDMAAFDAQIVHGAAVSAPRLERVPVKPWPRWHEMQLGEKTSLFDLQAQASRSTFRQVAR